MRALAVLLLVLAAHGSYALAGAVSSTVTLTNAATAPILGRLSDRRSQSVVIFGTLIAPASGIAGLLLLVQAGAPTWTLFVAAAVFGASALPIGSLVRARWAALLAGTPRVQTAFALEAFNDDLTYPGFGGVLIGLTVFAGSVAGLTYGGIAWKTGLVQRLAWIALLLGVGTLPLLLAHSLWLMAILALGAGIAITPMLVTMYALLSNLVPRTSITEGFAWFASVITLGSSTGIAVTGYLVDYAESFGALLFFAGAGCVAPVLVLLTRGLLDRRPFAEPEPAPAPQLVDTGAPA